MKNWELVETITIANCKWDIFGGKYEFAPGVRIRAEQKTAAFVKLIIEVVVTQGRIQGDRENSWMENHRPALRQNILRIAEGLE